MSNDTSDQKKRKRGRKTLELLNDPNVEKKMKLEEEIRELKSLISKMEHSLNVIKFKNVVSKGADKKTDFNSSARLINIQSQLQMEMYKYTGLYCSKFDTNCVFTLTSGRSCTKNSTYCIEVIKDEEITKIGRWVMPMGGINVFEIAKKYHISDPKFLKLCLKDCHHSITCYSHRESQFLETKEYLNDLKNCILEANYNYTIITIQIFRLMRVEPKECYNVRLNFYYNTYDIRPIRMNVESISYSTEVPADVMEYLYTAYKTNFDVKNLKEAMSDLFNMFENSTLFSWSKMVKGDEDFQTQHEEENTENEDDGGFLDTVIKRNKNSPKKGRSSRRKNTEEQNNEERSQEKNSSNDESLNYDEINNNSQDSELDEEEKRSKPNKRRKIDSEKPKAKKSMKEKVPNERKNVKSQKKNKKTVTFAEENTNIEASEVDMEDLESENRNTGDYDSGEAITKNLESNIEKISGGSAKNNIKTKNKAKELNNFSAKSLNSINENKSQKNKSKGSQGTIKKAIANMKLKQSNDKENLEKENNPNVNNKIEGNKKPEGNENNLDRSLRKSLLIRKTTENAEEINAIDSSQNISELTGNVKCSTPVAKSDINNMNRLLREEDISIIPKNN